MKLHKLLKVLIFATITKTITTTKTHYF